MLWYNGATQWGVERWAIQQPVRVRVRVRVRMPALPVCGGSTTHQDGLLHHLRVGLLPLGGAHDIGLHEARPEHARAPEVLGHRGAEHERLVGGRDRRLDLGDLGEEAPLHHAVRLVKHLRCTTRHSMSSWSTNAHAAVPPAHAQRWFLGPARHTPYGTRSRRLSRRGALTSTRTFARRARNASSAFACLGSFGGALRLLPPIGNCGRLRRACVTGLLSSSRPHQLVDPPVLDAPLFPPLTPIRSLIRPGVPTRRSHRLPVARLRLSVSTLVPPITVCTVKPRWNCARKAAFLAICTKG